MSEFCNDLSEHFG